MLEYLLERFLYRVSVHPLGQQHIVLKGGLLLAQFGARRVTRDIDIPGRAFPGDEQEIIRRITQNIHRSGRRAAEPGRSHPAGGSCLKLASQYYLTIIQVMTMIIPLADAKARLSAVLDDVRDTHDRVVITRNGRPEAVIISVADLETIEETLDLLSTPGAIDEIRTAEAEIARGEAIGADELRRLMAERVRNERDAG